MAPYLFMDIPFIRKFSPLQDYLALDKTFPLSFRIKEEIISASKSKYCPVPANIVLKEILKDKECEKFAVVWLPRLLLRKERK